MLLAKGAGRCFGERLAGITAIAMVLASVSIASASTAKPLGCFAEVFYTDQTHGHTYEYRCGGLKLHAGEIVRVPVGYGGITTARIVRISKVRTYFGGPLKTVRSVVA